MTAAAPCANTVHYFNSQNHQVAPPAKNRARRLIHHVSPPIKIFHQCRECKKVTPQKSKRVTHFHTVISVITSSLVFFSAEAFPRNLIYIKIWVCITCLNKKPCPRHGEYAWWWGQWFGGGQPRGNVGIKVKGYLY